MNPIVANAALCSLSPLFSSFPCFLSLKMNAVCKVLPTTSATSTAHPLAKPSASGIAISPIFVPFLLMSNPYMFRFPSVRRRHDGDQPDGRFYMPITSVNRAKSKIFIAPESILRTLTPSPSTNPLLTIIKTVGSKQNAAILNTSLARFFCIDSEHRSSA